MRLEDIYLSPLRKHIEALGGRLEVSAAFPDREPEPTEQIAAFSLGALGLTDARVRSKDVGAPAQLTACFSGPAGNRAGLRSVWGGYSSPENRSHAACRLVPIASPIRDQDT